MNFIKVTSSNIQTIGYDTQANTLRIIFSNGSIYDYSNIPSDIYNALINAQSIGKYFHQMIKNNYSYIKIS